MFCLDGLLYETYSCDTEFLLIGVHSSQTGAYCDLPPVLFLVPHRFNLLRVIHHQGNDRKSGHYYVSDVVNGLMLSDSIVRPSQFSSRHAYIALYQNSEVESTRMPQNAVSSPLVTQKAVRSSVLMQQTPVSSTNLDTNEISLYGQTSKAVEQPIVSEGPWNRQELEKVQVQTHVVQRKPRKTLI